MGGLYLGLCFVYLFIFIYFCYVILGLYLYMYVNRHLYRYKCIFSALFFQLIDACLYFSVEIK